ncbi:MAG: CDP-glucose 4,6-dehydratase [Pseudomonadota bacterium]
MDSPANPDPSFWQGRRVLLTGHTGFKGAWLSQWLTGMGAQVTGLSLGPLEGESLWVKLGDGAVARSLTVDICEAQATKAAIHDASPQVILHLAAQSLVRTSFTAPLETFATNVMGTAHVLDAARDLADCRAVVSVTSDKAYENREQIWAYREDDPMGGHDPYSASKGAAELVTASMRRSYFEGTSTGVASARAGNVIGGGDWAKDRLVPDCLGAFAAGQQVEIRNPAATRPWQHVLEPLAGYLVLAESLADDPAEFAEGWNFGPCDDDVLPVEYIADRLVALWGGDAGWFLTEGAHPHEAMALNVDATKARYRLGWQPRLDLDTALQWTVDWQRGLDGGRSAADLCAEQIARYIEIPSKRPTA